MSITHVHAYMHTCTYVYVVCSNKTVNYMFPCDVHKTTESRGMCKLYDPVQLNA